MLHQSGNALRMLGVGNALKKTVGSAKGGEAHLRAIDQWRKAFVMALAGLAEEHGLDRAAGTQRFFDQANPFDSHKAAFRGQTAAERHAKFLEPSIVAAGEERGFARVANGAGGFARRGHSWEGSRLQPASAHD